MKRSGVLAPSPEHNGEQDVIKLVTRHHIHMAHAGRDYPHRHLFRPRLIQQQIFDPEGPPFSRTTLP
jgi:hypothetical protein